MSLLVLSQMKLHHEHCAYWSRHLLVCDRLSTDSTQGTSCLRDRPKHSPNPQPSPHHSLTSGIIRWLEIKKAARKRLKKIGHQSISQPLTTRSLRRAAFSFRHPLPPSPVERLPVPRFELCAQRHDALGCWVGTCHHRPFKAQVHSVSSEQFGWPEKKEEKRFGDDAEEVDIYRERDWR